ncbi:MAG: hypothetical protein K1000chlam2_00260 [Chlamydiae bacterium]|nr:hypothetical protein [Chlamydiota bacterium]
MDFSECKLSQSTIEELQKKNESQRFLLPSLKRTLEETHEASDVKKQKTTQDSK